MLDGRTYVDFENKIVDQDIKGILQYIDYAIVIIALLLYLADIKINQVAYIIFIGNMLLSVPCVFSIDNRYGWDYVAYIQQASAFLNGERNYTQISSNQGPCYYPAGHLWHYSIVYWVHMKYTNGETIFKVVHMIIHSITNVYTYKIAKLIISDRES